MNIRTKAAKRGLAEVKLDSKNLVLVEQFLGALKALPKDNQDQL